ncbi:MAG: hypothetical protein ACPLZG_08245 [Thermoproteota archaeon]
MIEDLVDTHNLLSGRYYKKCESLEEFYVYYFQEISISLSKIDEKQIDENKLEDLKRYKDIIGEYCSVTDTFKDIKENINKYDKNNSEVCNLLCFSFLLYYGIIVAFVWATTFLNDQIDHCYAIAYNLFSTSRRGGLYWSFLRLLKDYQKIECDLTKNKKVPSVRYKFEQELINNNKFKNIFETRNKSVLTHGYCILYSLKNVDINTLRDMWLEFYRVINEVIKEMNRNQTFYGVSDLSATTGNKDDLVDVKLFLRRISEIVENLEVVRKMLIDKEIKRVIKTGE